MWARILLVSALVLASCGDDAADRVDAGSSDGATTAPRDASSSGQADTGTMTSSDVGRISCQRVGQIGERCVTVGATCECVDGAVCTGQPGTVNMCLPVCSDAGDCDPGASCEPVADSGLSSCR